MNEDIKALSLRIPVKLHDRLKAVGEKRRKSLFLKSPQVSQLILEAIDEFVTRELDETPM